MERGAACRAPEHSALALRAEEILKVRKVVMSQEKIALVTGASSGIGKACALARIKAGFTEVQTARRKDKLDDAAAEGATLGKCLAVPSDMTHPASIAALFATVKEKFGRLDL